MRRLMLLRHAKSDWPTGVDDHERPLAKRGRRASPLIGKYMQKEGLVPDLAVISTARRTQETWKLALPAFSQSIARRDEPRIYEATTSSILDTIHETCEDINALLLVGHNPGLQSLALELTATANRADLTWMWEKYPTGGLAVIDFDIESWRGVYPATGKLERFVTPRLINLAA